MRPMGPGASEGPDDKIVGTVESEELRGFLGQGWPGPGGPWPGDRPFGHSWQTCGAAEVPQVQQSLQTMAGSTALTGAARLPGAGIDGPRESGG